MTKKNNTMLFPNKKYNIIYADPPWTYKVWSKKGAGRTASSHYNVMSLNDIKQLPVSSISASDSILFLWVTMPNLIEGLETIKFWGFTYKTCGFTWLKTYKSGKPVCGLGYWTRANAELCLLATKGKPKRVSKGVYQAVVSQQREHSRKPDCVRGRIVELMGDLPRIELFARQQTPGWDVWGDEVFLHKNDVDD
mgnify:CR=1 FL=1